MVDNKVIQIDIDGLRKQIKQVIDKLDESGVTATINAKLIGVSYTIGGLLDEFSENKKVSNDYFKTLASKLMFSIRKLDEVKSHYRGSIFCSIEEISATVKKIVKVLTDE